MIGRDGALLSYFALVYGITWVPIGALLWSLGFDFAAVGVTELLVMFGFMLLGPAAAGLSLTAALGGRRELVALARRIGHVRVPLRWYALALLTVPVLLSAVLLPLSIWISPTYAPSFLLFGVLAGLLAGVLEEIGWTGFAAPRLLARYSPLKAGLILGLAWAAWHGLADFSGNVAAMGLGGWLLWMLTFWIIPLTGYRVLMTWVYARARSLPLAMLMHASYTGWLVTLTMEMQAATGSDALLWHLLFGAGIWAVVAVVMLRSPAARPSTAFLPA